MSVFSRATAMCHLPLGSVECPAGSMILWSISNPGPVSSSQYAPYGSACVVTPLAPCSREIRPQSSRGGLMIGKLVSSWAEIHMWLLPRELKYSHRVHHSPPFELRMDSGHSYHITEGLPLAVPQLSSKLIVERPPAYP